MHRIAHMLIGALLALTLAPLCALAQAPTTGTLDAAARKAAVEQTAVRLRDRYVMIEPGAAAAAKIEAKLAAGDYDGLTDPRAFATALTADLYEVTHDKHLAVRAINAPPPPGAAPPPAPIRSEAGVVRADRLAGGVGYIEISGFPSPEAFKPVINKAMAALADAPALIIDLRRNGGGSAMSVDYLASFFVDGTQKVKILDYRQRIPGTPNFVTQQSWNVATPTSYLGRPVYVLTSPRTFSGGEGLAYELQSMKIAKTVGEVTGGGANPGGSGPITPLFSMFVPSGSPVHPATGTNWEGVGVIPDVAAPVADALKVALQQLGQSPASGDIAVLAQASLFAPRSTALPGSEAALRTMIESIAKGEPAYDLMTADRQRVVRTEFTRLQGDFSAMGPIQSLTFTGVSPQGMDSYTVKLANATWLWDILLDANGKVASWGRRAAPASEEQRQAAFKANDKDGDGKLDKAGYLAALRVLGFAEQIDTLFAQRDVNKDGFVSVEEYRTPIPQ